MTFKGTRILFLILITLIGIIESLPAGMEHLGGIEKGIIGINKIKNCPPGMMSNIPNICNVMGNN